MNTKNNSIDLVIWARFLLSYIRCSKPKRKFIKWFLRYMKILDTYIDLPDYESDIHSILKKYVFLVLNNPKEIITIPGFYPYCIIRLLVFAMTIYLNSANKKILNYCINNQNHNPTAIRYIDFLDRIAVKCCDIDKSNRLSTVIVMQRINFSLDLRSIDGSVNS